jgi:hypothetical protein
MFEVFRILIRWNVLDPDPQHCSFLPTSLCVKITHEHAYVLYALFRSKQKVIYGIACENPNRFLLQER